MSQQFWVKNTRFNEQSWSLTDTCRDWTSWRSKEVDVAIKNNCVTRTFYSQGGLNAPTSWPGLVRQVCLSLCLPNGLHVRWILSTFCGSGRGPGASHAMPIKHGLQENPPFLDEFFPWKPQFLADFLLIFLYFRIVYGGFLHLWVLQGPSKMDILGQRLFF